MIGTAFFCSIGVAVWVSLHKGTISIILWWAFMGGGVDRHFQRVILAGPVILHEVVHSLFDAIA